MHIGALVAPKARLGYDLAKRRYGVTASELINMAPLFFALLAEGSLAHRRGKLGDAHEAIERLDNLCDDADNKMFVRAVMRAEDAYGVEWESIERSDVFGDFLLDPGSHVGLWDDVFDPSTTNPFASYLRRLAADLESTRSIKVETDGLSYGSPDKFPDYDICAEELDRITNGSPDARRALQGGYARITEIPAELMSDEEGDARAALLAERLPAVYRNLEGGGAMDEIAKHEATMTPPERARLAALSKYLSELDFGGADTGEDQ